MARTASSTNVSPKSMRRLPRSSTPSRLSAPPKKVAKIATPSKSSVKLDFLNPRILLSKTLDLPSDLRLRKSPVKGLKTTAKPFGPKAKFLSKVAACIYQLKDRNGSSRSAILNQLKLDYPTDIGNNEATINMNLKMALKKGLEEGVLKIAKESGKGSGSFKLTPQELKKHKAETIKNSNEVKKVENDNTLEK